MSELLTPDIVAQRFMKCYDLYLKGELNEDVWPVEWQGKFIMNLRGDPHTMAVYFIQVAYFVKQLADEQFGDLTQESTNAMTQFYGVMTSWFVQHLGVALQENTLLTQILMERGEHEMTMHLNKPEVQPEEVFKNIEGLDFVEWLDDTDDPTKPPSSEPPQPPEADQGTTEDKPES